MSQALRTRLPDLPALHPLRELVTRAQGGDNSVIPCLKAILESSPETWKQVGDLIAQVEGAHIAAIAEGDLYLKECLEQKLADLKLELGMLTATPLERLLIERIAICWLALHHAEMLVVDAGDLTTGYMSSHVKRLDYYHRRYFSAVRSLALVRRLLPKKNA